MGLVRWLEKTADRLEEHVEAERSKFVEDYGHEPKIINLATVREEASKRLAGRGPGWAQRALVFENEIVQEPLQPEQVDDLMAAAEEFHREYEKHKPPTVLTAATAEEFLKWLGHRHPNKLRRIGRDLDWLRDQAKKHGIPMEEVRWLL